MSAPVLFTVFTPTFDRAHRLERVYRSLAAQTCPDFEWLVVDDGSTDDTAAVVADWVATAPFPVRYLHQEHAGKHVAFNHGVRHARGELFLVLDSDDECLPEALERFAAHWHALAPAERPRFCGVTGLCVDQHGRPVGTPFPRSPTDSNALELRYRHRTVGEKWGFNRTEVLREHPFPQLEGQPFVTESVVWNRIARTYRTRYVNEALRIYHRYEETGALTESAKQPRARAPMFALKNRLVLDEELDWFPLAPSVFVRAAANYARYSWHEGTSWRAQHDRLRGGWARLLHLVAAPLGAVARRHDEHRACE